jgi:hypothetical protein
MKCLSIRPGSRNLLLLALALSFLPATWAATTIDAVNRYAYGANIGWLDAYADGANGAVLGDNVCMGYLYAANVGWIFLGNGAPLNGIQYGNASATDYGVNHDGFGHLSGYAYGANIGWIAFEATGAPKVDLRTGILSGYIWSANCGWISLSNSVAFVQTDSFWPGQLDSNGLPYWWELTHFGAIGINPNADPDHDGMSNMQEYLAGTDPNNGLDYLHITAYGFGPGGTSVGLTWTSVLNRFYHISLTPSLSGGGIWSDSGLGLISPDVATTMRTFFEISAPTRFYRVRASRPLAP